MQCVNNCHNKYAENLKLNYHLPVRILDEGFQNFGPSIGFDAILDVVVGEGEKRVGGHDARHQVVSRVLRDQPLFGRPIVQNGGRVLADGNIVERPFRVLRFHIGIRFGGNVR